MGVTAKIEGKTWNTHHLEPLFMPRLAPVEPLAYVWHLCFIKMRHRRDSNPCAFTAKEMFLDLDIAQKSSALSTTSRRQLTPIPHDKDRVIWITRRTRGPWTLAFCLTTAVDTWNIKIICRVHRMTPDWNELMAHEMYLHISTCNLLHVSCTISLFRDISH